MKMDITLYCALLCICMQGCTSSNVITLNATDNSTCAGVVQVNAKVKFTAVVDLTSWHNSWSKTVIFEFRSPDAIEFSHLCMVNLRNNTCSYTSELMCYCSKKTQEMYHIVINVHLTEENSRAEIRGYVKHTDRQQWYSEVQRYPTFYNLSVLNYTINGRSLNQSSNIFELKTNETTIRFCCRDLPSPCRANIKHQQELVASGDPFAVYNISSTHQQGSFNLTLAYDFCKQTKEINVLFFSGYKSTIWISFVLIIGIIASVVGMAFFIAVCYYYRAKSCRHYALDETTHSTQTIPVENVNNSRLMKTQYTRRETEENLYDTVIDDHPSTVEQQPTHSVPDGYLVIIDNEDIV